VDFKSRSRVSWAMIWLCDGCYLDATRLVSITTVTRQRDNSLVSSLSYFGLTVSAVESAPGARIGLCAFVGAVAQMDRASGS